MDDLATWLRAQLDEDERVAQAEAEHAHEWFEGDGWGDPARVLREVAAKRQLLDRCLTAFRDQGIYGEDGQEDVAKDVLRHLAAVYADRPGYLAEWAT